MLLEEKLAERSAVSTVVRQQEHRPSEKHTVCLAASCAPEMQQYVDLIGLQGQVISAQQAWQV